MIRSCAVLRRLRRARDRRVDHLRARGRGAGERRDMRRGSSCPSRRSVAPRSPANSPSPPRCTASEAAIVGQHGDDDVRGLRQRRGVPATRAAGLRRPAPRPCRRERFQTVTSWPGADEVPRHRRAHAAEPGKADAHHAALSGRCPEIAWIRLSSVTSSEVKVAHDPAVDTSR